MLHTNFPEVTWMIYVKVDSEMKRATSATLASWVLPVLANASVDVTHVAPMFLGLPQLG